MPANENVGFPAASLWLPPLGYNLAPHHAPAREALTQCDGNVPSGWHQHKVTAVRVSLPHVFFKPLIACATCVPNTMFVIDASMRAGRVEDCFEVRRRAYESI
jgi:hypothetical protein